LIIDRHLNYIVASKTAIHDTIRAENRLARELKSVMGRVGQEIIQKLIEKDRIPRDRMFVNQLMQYMERHKPEMKNLIFDAVSTAAERGVDGVIRDAELFGIDIRFDKINPKVKERIARTALESAESAIGRIKTELREGLVEAYEKGLGIDDAVGVLRERVDGLSDRELGRIARTEINSAQNQAIHEKIKELSRFKQWWSAEDENVRDSHQDLHGQITRVEDNFRNGLKHPGDKSGPIEEWINCRCTEVPFIMPRGMMAPPGRITFYENDLVSAA